jgi:hypothetical protein
MIMNRILKIFLIITITNSLWAQSPWLQKKKSLLTQLSYNTIGNYNQLYLSSGETFSTERNLTDNTIQAWFEYGLLDNTSFNLIIPIKLLKAADLVETNGQSQAKTANGSLNALGNAALSWKQNLIKESWLLSSTVNLEFPTATYEEETGLRSGYDAWAVSATLSSGRGFGSAYFYAHLGLGTRTNDYSSFYTGGLEGGYHISDPLWIAGVINVLQSFKDGNRQDPENNLLTGLYVNDQEFISWGLKLFGSIIPDKLGYSAALFGAFSGNFVAKSPSLNLGFHYIFNL